MIKRAIFFFHFLLIFMIGHLASQNGRILQENEVPLTEELHFNILNFGKVLPKLTPFLEGIFKKAELVEVKEITYLSDRLKVKAFLLEPKKEGKYPCLIVNRGGNRNFGIWTREEAYFVLTEISS